MSLSRNSFVCRGNEGVAIIREGQYPRYLPACLATSVRLFICSKPTSLSPVWDKQKSGIKCAPLSYQTDGCIEFAERLDCWLARLPVEMQSLFPFSICLARSGWQTRHQEHTAGRNSDNAWKPLIQALQIYFLFSNLKIQTDECSTTQLKLNWSAGLEVELVFGWLPCDVCRYRQGGIFRVCRAWPMLVLFYTQRQKNFADTDTRKGYLV